MNVTKVSAQYPPIMTKVLDVDEHGVLTKTPAAHLSRGTFEVKKVDTLKKLKTLIESLNNNEILLYGIPVSQQTSGTIASRKQAVNGDITRTREAFAFSTGPSWLMLDIDVDEDTLARGPDTSWEGIYNLLGQCIPDFRTTIPHLKGHSAGSYIFCKNTSEQLIGERGKRIYIQVANGSDIPRAGRALSERLKAKGCLHYKISKAGTLLERGLIDDQMFQPERIDFCSGARCTGNCYQDRPKLECVNSGKDPLDTAGVIKDIKQVEEIELAQHRTTQSLRVEDEKNIQREKWCAERMQDKPKNVSVDEFKATLNAAANGGTLDADFPIILAPDRKPVMVAELLADPRGYNGVLCYDPLEPDYNNFSPVGKVYLNGARPLVYSMAHGGRKYFLNRKRHQIPVADGVTEETADRCLKLLAGNMTIYRRGNYLAEASEGAINALVDPAQVESHLDRQIQFTKSTRSGSVPTDCPPKVAKRIMVKQNAWEFHHLRGVITLPVMRLDGSIMDVPGYDAHTQLLYNAEPGDEGCNVVMHPTRTEVSDALFRLWRPFSEFPFIDDASRGSVLAAILTTAVRPVLPTAPGYIINAPEYGTGKTLLARAICHMTGRTPSITGWPKTDEEQGKLLSSILRTGCEALILDNLPGNLKGETLAGIMTSPTWEARILGKSEKMSVSTNTMLFATGKNAYAVKDLARRFCVCRINAISEHPELRDFDFSPVDLICSNVKQYRTDALTVLRGFVSAGLPKSSTTSMGSFEDWDRIIRNCICWLIKEATAPIALADPTESQAESLDSDPDRMKVRLLITSWFSVFGCADISAAELKRFYDGDAEPLGGWNEERVSEFEKGSILLTEALRDVADDSRARGSINTRILGWYLDKHKDAVVDDLRLFRTERKTGNRTHYRVEKIS